MGGYAAAGVGGYEEVDCVIAFFGSGRRLGGKRNRRIFPPNPHFLPRNMYAIHLIALPYLPQAPLHRALEGKKCACSGVNGLFCGEGEGREGLGVECWFGGAGGVEDEAGGCGCEGEEGD